MAHDRDPLHVGSHLCLRRVGVDSLGERYIGVRLDERRWPALVRIYDARFTEGIVGANWAPIRRALLVTHPKVLPLHDLGVTERDQDERRCYVIASALNAVTAAALVRAERARGEAPPIGIVARIALDVCDALCAAHASPHHLTHGELTLDRVLVGFDGTTLVADLEAGALLAMTEESASAPDLTALHLLVEALASAGGGTASERQRMCDPAGSRDLKRAREGLRAIADGPPRITAIDVSHYLTRLFSVDPADAEIFHQCSTREAEVHDGLRRNSWQHRPLTRPRDELVRGLVLDPIFIA